MTKPYEPPPAPMRKNMTPHQLDKETDKMWNSLTQHGGMKTTGETVQVKKSEIEIIANKKCPTCLGLYRAMGGKEKCKTCGQSNDWFALKEAHKKTVE